MELGTFFSGALGRGIGSLVGEVVKKLVVTDPNPSDIRKMNLRFNKFCAACEETIIEFINNENISDDKLDRIFVELRILLQPYLDDSERFVTERLNGRALFDKLFPTTSSIPITIIGDGTADVFERIFVFLAENLAGLSMLVERNRNIAIITAITQLDQILEKLETFSIQIAEIAANTDKRDHSLLMRARRHILETSAYEIIDLAGLSNKGPLRGPIDAFFVPPSILTKHNAAGSDREILDVVDESTAVGVDIHVVAPPGAGKTTWSKFLQRQVAGLKKARRLPVWLALRKVDWDSPPTWRSLVRDALELNQREDLNEEILRDWRDHGDILFILDGFDEIPIEKRNAAVAFLSAIRDSNDKCPIIVTSRELTTSHLKDFPSARWRIAKLNDDQVLTYITKWKDNHAVLPFGNTIDDPSHFLKEIKSNRTVRELAGTPLLLNTILSIHHVDGSLATSKGRLYQQYVHGMIQTWPEQKGINTFEKFLTYDEQYYILQRIALHMQLEERDTLPAAEARDLTAQLLNELNRDVEPDTFLQAVKERSGLIEWPGSFEFIHKSISEFLTADAIRRGNALTSNGETIDRAWFRSIIGKASSQSDIGSHLDRWLNVLSFWGELAGEGDVIAFIRNLLDDKKPGTALILASERMPHLSQPLRDAIWDDWIKRGDVFGSPQASGGPSSLEISTQTYSIMPTPIHPSALVEDSLRNGYLSAAVIRRHTKLPCWILDGMRCASQESADVRSLYIEVATDNDLWLGPHKMTGVGPSDMKLLGKSYVWNLWKLLEDVNQFRRRGQTSTPIAQSQFLSSEGIPTPDDGALWQTYSWNEAKRRDMPIDLLLAALRAFLACADKDPEKRPSWWNNEVLRLSDAIRRRRALSSQKNRKDKAFELLEKARVEPSIETSKTDLRVS